ncbi:glycosyltransferase family 4 protein [Candidatus Microgenomates bacterium]|nr:glycosyltransferase family 4 protein [Candidatus Microgenomates bacterium]
MKAAIYNPYWDTLGGGERYCISVAEILSRNGYQVDIEWKDKDIISKLEKRFGLSLSNINVVEDVNRGDGYDLLFWVSDGSIPTLKARRNLLHFQFPFKNVNGNTLLNKMKFFRINKTICNSHFTKDIVDKEYGIDSIVIYPPVDVEKFKQLKKENTIIYVGRFSELTQSKRQDKLIETFKRFHDSGNTLWKLILVGGVEVGSGEFLEKLKDSAKTYPIKIIQSPDFRELKNLVGSSKFFWSAAGFGIDERENPTKVEHFGITVVESMAAGVVPIIYNAGGSKEIVQNGQNGYLWDNDDQLISNTNKLIIDAKLFRKLSLKAKEDSQKYNYERFEKELLSLL